MQCAEPILLSVRSGQQYIVSVCWSLSFFLSIVIYTAPKPVDASRTMGRRAPPRRSAVTLEHSATSSRPIRSVTSPFRALDSVPLPLAIFKSPSRQHRSFILYSIRRELSHIITSFYFFGNYLNRLEDDVLER